MRYIVWMWHLETLQYDTGRWSRRCMGAVPENNGRPGAPPKMHLGSNLYMSVDSPYKCVQIREWKQNPSGRYLATRIGISLFPSSFKKLCSIDVDMDKTIPELCDTTRCAFSPDHQNMLGALAYWFCNPNGHLNYWAAKYTLMRIFRK